MFYVADLVENKSAGVQTYNLFGTFNPQQFEEYTNLIKEGKYDVYMDRLSAVNLDDYKSYMQRLLFLISLVIAFKDSPENNLKEKAVNVTIAKWQNPNDDDPAGVLGDLINSILCPMDAIKQLLTYYDDIIPLEIIESQINNENTFNMNLMFERITELFKSTTAKRNVLEIRDFQYLRLKAERYNHKEIIEWIDNKLKGIMTVAEKPDWVNLLPEETKSILDLDLWRDTGIFIPEVDTEPLVNLLRETFTLKKEGEDVDDMTLKEITDTAFKTASNTSTLNQSIDESKYPTDPDRMFGPVNKRPDSDCVSGIVKGGCRMLTCRCRDFDQSDDKEPTDIDPSGWFNGICDGCERTIQDISYSLRYPIINGGWVGCFCSVICIKLKPSRDPSQNGELILDAIFNVIENKGIVDRLKLIEADKVSSEKTDDEIEYFFEQSSAVSQEPLLPSFTT